MWFDQCEADDPQVVFVVRSGIKLSVEYSCVVTLTVMLGGSFCLLLSDVSLGVWAVRGHDRKAN